MKNGTIVAIFCGVAAFALTSSAAAKDFGVLPGAPVDVMTTVNAIREVPAGNPLPGLHLDAKVNGRTVDIYIAPMSFVTKFGVNVAKGSDVHIIGTQEKVGASDVVVVREIETGVQTKGAFRPNLTIYTRNDDGPFWVEDTAPRP